MEKLWFKHVVEGNPKEMEIPEISLPQLFSETVTKYASHTAMTFFNQTYTYTQLDKQIKRLSSALHKIGVKKGDRVALMLPNCPQYPISYYAALCCGATIVQINPMYKATELLHVLNDSEAEVLVVLEQLFPVVQEVIDETSITSTITVSFENDCRFNELLKDDGDTISDVSINHREDKIGRASC